MLFHSIETSSISLMGGGGGGKQGACACDLDHLSGHKVMGSFDCVHNRSQTSRAGSIS